MAEYFAEKTAFKCHLPYDVVAGFAPLMVSFLLCDEKLGVKGLKYLGRINCWQIKKLPIQKFVNNLQR